MLLIKTREELEEEQSAGFTHTSTQDVVLHMPCAELCKRHRALWSGESWLPLSALIFRQLSKM